MKIDWKLHLDDYWQGLKIICVCALVFAVVFGLCALGKYYPTVFAGILLSLLAILVPLWVGMAKRFF